MGLTDIKQAVVKAWPRRWTAAGLNERLGRTRGLAEQVVAVAGVGSVSG